MGNLLKIKLSLYVFVQFSHNMSKSAVMKEVSYTQDPKIEVLKQII